jgi:hypothetical protein
MFVKVQENLHALSVSQQQAQIASHEENLMHRSIFSGFILNVMCGVISHPSRRLALHAIKDWLRVNHSCNIFLYSSNDNVLVLDIERATTSESRVARSGIQELIARHNI